MWIKIFSKFKQKNLLGIYHLCSYVVMRYVVFNFKYFATLRYPLYIYQVNFASASNKTK